MHFYEQSQYGKLTHYIIPAVWHSRKEETIETIESPEVTRHSGQRRGRNRWTWDFVSSKMLLFNSVMATTHETLPEGRT